MLDQQRCDLLEPRLSLEWSIQTPSTSAPSHTAGAFVVPGTMTMAKLRPCTTCGTPCPPRQCPRCGPATRNARGYGPDHRRARAALAATLPAPCGYGCGKILTPDSPWVAAHIVDGDPSQGYVPSCRSCNEQAKGQGGPESSGR